LQVLNWKLVKQKNPKVQHQLLVFQFLSLSLSSCFRVVPPLASQEFRALSRTPWGFHWLSPTCFYCILQIPLWQKEELRMSWANRNWSQVTDIHTDFRVTPGIDSLMNGDRKDKNLMDQALINFNLQHNFT